ncbi:hypothetical protein EB001_25610, partial [bacterium]|nr:hypothetical protein [bacterium]
ITEVYNESGATLTKGTVVYINGGHGNLPTITKALATSDATSAQTYGVVQADITNNNNGYVVAAGRLLDLDTQAYAAGTQLYLSSTTAGAWTSTKQYAPAHLVYVGIVVRSHPTQGVVEVKIQNGYELDELHNVSAQSPNNGDILQYVTSTGLWTSVAGSTTNIAEGTNLYYTDARARASNSFAAGSGAYNSTTGVITIPTNNNQITNGAGYITLTSLSLSSTDWNTFNSKQSALTFSSPLVNTSGTVSIPAATSSVNGYLTSTDWSTFNGKQAALSGTGIVKSTAGTISYLTDNSTNWNTAYNDSIVSAAVTGTTTKTLTLTQQDAGTITASWTDYDTAPVTSVFGRTGAVVATEGDYTLTQLGDVTITSPTTGQVLKYNGTTWINDTDANTGTVTSVGLSAPTGFSVTGSPVTSSGTLALAFATGYSLPTTASQSNWDTAYTNRITSATSPLSITSNVISISQATTST